MVVNCFESVTLLLLFTLLQAFNVNGLLTNGSTSWTFRCPCVCDFDTLLRKRVICTDLTIPTIPTSYMDSGTQVISVSGTDNNHLNLTIGRIFQDFDNLEEVVITRSGIPAIGDSSFWPGKKLALVNLSQNNISVLKETDFNGLSYLNTLILDDNNIVVAPSAAFQRLTNLTKLSLAKNKMTKLVPRMFYRLDKLEHLDLSFNPLSQLDVEEVKDLKSLKKLFLQGGRLDKVHSLVYQTLSTLEELDLRDNLLTEIKSHEFKHLPHLKILLLDGNRLTQLHDNTFFGHSLDSLGLSRNSIESLGTCTFCNATVKRLDMSRNRIKDVHEVVFQPLEESLINLNIEENFNLINPSKAVYNTIRPLTKLRVLSISFMKLDDTLPDGIFISQGRSLRLLDMRGNNIVNLSVKWFEPLDFLEELDISQNKIILLPRDLLKKLDSIITLKSIFLNDNPWSCFRCHILPLLDWLATKPKPYTSVCKVDNNNPEGNKDDTKFCVFCDSPSELQGRRLEFINEFQLEWCVDTNVPLRLAASEPKVGLILAILIIIAIIAVIVSIVVTYRKKQGATYYTHEESDFLQRSRGPSIYTIDKMNMYPEALISSPSSHGFHFPHSTPYHPSLTPNHTRSESRVLLRTLNPNNLSPPSFSPPQQYLPADQYSPTPHHHYIIATSATTGPSGGSPTSSPPMSPSSQSMCSIPPPPPLPPPDLPCHLRRQSSRMSVETRPKVRM